MPDYLGIDTSNYTTSAAVFDSSNSTVTSEKMMLPVKTGEKGIRQSDAVFHHTVQLPQVIEKIGGCVDKLSALGVSVSPRSEEGSYMPCFLTGISVAASLSSVMNIPLYRFSHQMGHIAAVLYGSGRTDLLNKSFIAFHLSGGTTEVVLVTPDKADIFNTRIIAKSLDLKAGQAIDRTGVMLSMSFPCGAELDMLSRKSDKIYNINASIKDGDCSLSGIENKTKKMFNDGESAEDIAKFCFSSIISAVDGMTANCIKEYGNLPLVFSGGVSSNSMLREYFRNKYDAVFAKPEFSADNAVGIAYLAAVKDN